MKKLWNRGRYCLSLLMASALSFTACTEKEDFNLDNNHKLQVTFGVNSHGSRAINCETSLPDGSQVGARLDGYTGYENLVYTASTGKTPQSWTGDKDVALSDVSGTLYAYYPYNKDIDITAIPVDMTAADQTDWLYGVPATGITDLNPEVDVTMNHALANINLSIVRDTYAGNGEITSISVQSDGIASKGTFNAAQATPGYTAFTVKGETLERSVETTLGATDTDIMVIPTGTEAAITFFVTVDDVLYSVKSAPLTLEMGNSYQYTLKLNSTFMSVDGVSVTPWNNVPKEDDLELEEYDEFDAGIVATYYIDEASLASRAAGVEVQLLSSDSKFQLSNIDRMKVDGVEVTPSKTYTFTSAGNHTVKYLLKYNTQVPWYMFYNCKALTAYKLPETVTKIGENAFAYCTGLTGELVIPNSVQTIEEAAFSSCSGITEITIPNSVQTIGKWTFNQCSGIKGGNLYIPKSVTEIGTAAFYQMDVETIVVDEKNTVYDSRNNCNAIMETATNTLLKGSRETVIPNDCVALGLGSFSMLTIDELTIPSSVKEFQGSYSYFDGVFYKAKINTINFSEGLEIIGNYAFEGCSRLTSVTIPNSVQTIGQEAFSYCTGMTELILGEGVQTIGSESFYKCEGLTGTLTIPESVTTIGEEAFKGCTGITELFIEDGLENIGASAFRSMGNLKTITLGSTIKNIGDNCFNYSGVQTIIYKSMDAPILGTGVFGNCPNNGVVIIPVDGRGYSNIIQSTWKCREDNESENGIYYSSDGKIAMMMDTNYSGTLTFKEGVETIAKNAFKGCTGITGTLTIPNSVQTIGMAAFSGCSGIKGTLTIPESVTSIGASAFADCTGISGTLIIPNSVQTIKSGMFRNCYNLNKIIISDDIHTIESSAFNGCRWLQEIVIGEGVQTIGENAFYCCESIKSITSHAMTAPNVQSNTFQRIKSGGTLYVPQGATGYDAWMGTDDYYLGKYNWTMQTISE